MATAQTTYVDLDSFVPREMFAQSPPPILQGVGDFFTARHLIALIRTGCPRSLADSVCCRVPGKLKFWNFRLVEDLVIYGVGVAVAVR